MKILRLYIYMESDQGSSYDHYDVIEKFLSNDSIIRWDEDRSADGLLQGFEIEIEADKYNKDYQITTTTDKKMNDQVIIPVGNRATYVIRDTRFPDSPARSFVGISDGYPWWTSFNMCHKFSSFDDAFSYKSTFPELDCTSILEVDYIVATKCDEQVNRENEYQEELRKLNEKYGK